ncbi:YiiX/YebB-like N1pC/P60 family cysteine hydrolase [Prolixibacteraceae bacterium]|nr:YiiX/YebB-like N1pC/P60 family cysteine hydrolase [Prolixibacteraceae bacterium]
MKWLWIVMSIFGLISCNPRVRRGDLLFRSSIESSLSSSINNVTGDVGYSHMGIADTLNGEIVVYHASPNGGVHCSTLIGFVQEDQVPHRVDVFRIDNPIRFDVSSALVKSRSLVGEPYNNTYVIEDRGYYCSEFIYEIFKKDSVFQLEPMTFKDPKTQQFDEGWVSYYKKIGIDIPEGQLGCNPNKMSKHPDLSYFFSIKEEDIGALNP